MWQMDSNRPIYIQLVERIIKEIIAGKYQPGEKMPTVRELAEIARVNPNTMQKAFSQLEQKGMLYTDRTVGRYVTQDQAKIREKGKQLARQLGEKFLADMRALGLTEDEIMEVLKTLMSGDKA
ncbi:GntR family transcriptional regulator [Clostridiales bacterium COT073_COT-073]|nr:GntR family transcriptional regulator [Clostridiales bacterium COT073_COT-073]